MVAALGSRAQGDHCSGGGRGLVCHGRTVAVGTDLDAVLCRCRRRRCVLLEDCFNLDVSGRHGELIVLNLHAASDDLPLLEGIAALGSRGQGDHCSGRGRGLVCHGRTVAVGADRDAVLCRCRALDEFRLAAADAPAGVENPFALALRCGFAVVPVMAELIEDMTVAEDLSAAARALLVAAVASGGAGRLHRIDHLVVAGNFVEGRGRLALLRDPVARCAVLIA